MTAVLPGDDTKISDEVDDDVDHAICAWCYPGYIPGRKVVSLCGVIDDDCEPDEDFFYDEADCPMCRMFEFCPACGADLSL